MRKVSRLCLCFQRLVILNYSSLFLKSDRRDNKNDAPHVPQKPFEQTVLVKQFSSTLANPGRLVKLKSGIMKPKCTCTVQRLFRTRLRSPSGCDTIALHKITQHKVFVHILSSIARNYAKFKTK